MDINIAIYRLKTTRKAPGMYNLSSELFKNGEEDLITQITTANSEKIGGKDTRA